MVLQFLSWFRDRDLKMAFFFQELREASLLLFLNKQDESPSVTIEEITEKFALYKLFCGRSWHIQACDAISGTGLTDGLDWLSRQLVTAIP